MPTCMVTMDPIDVDCHNQLIGHLPACSRSGGHAFDLAADCQQPLSLPNTMVADRRYGGALFKSNSGLFLLPACLFGGEKRSLTMLWFSYQGSTLAVSVRKQGREELRKWKPKPGEAHLPSSVGTLRKAVVGNLLASLPHLWRALIHSCPMTTHCHPSAS